MNTPVLISAEDLQLRLSSARPPVVWDASFDLTDPEAGEAAWRSGHIPAAHYAHLERDLSAPKTGRNGRHPLPAREAFAATAARLGVTPDTHVVVYDRQGSPYAARAWWMLKWLGHEAVSVLDGGLAAWQDAGGRVSATPTAPLATATPYPLREPLVSGVDADALLARLGSPALRLVDARAPERYRGDVEPLDPVAGHIPGALNRFFQLNLGPDGRFKPAAQLRQEFESLLGGQPPAEVVHQCGSGVTACHNLLAMEAAGLTGSSLYPGSWSEWCADPARPVARGAA
ncbi:sulfurtransferase [Caldimonas thermodepolymerans]|jgi:Rhodanese-related sulfurtransferase|uniref:Sulfurtransferase n=1 Tax=Caldimonas thermodepolymerans TaxID=215580 RepID=A0A2S5T9F9_9BURK|nr:sulfurtransferase [Caldimonas thermodepolymerans]PPE71640.1 sulfurtransferase [Caldimonas thermodepolymerans]QPC30667.1 sulfurtransferase [Caldimonas thermodepolymerans]RDI02725.1 thiosulfate/3-mercaptopyruvate sulfurtransferase [Caldimonas thermodepolymerans]TCP08745.1 thiosulfate/3-mercaptopyruvate sulfurtransferase [Caldimonas thermodepolymerans]UZG47067.1 sulfurtransferase [Caldimonas thermodepolymerans]